MAIIQGLANSQWLCSSYFLFFSIYRRNFLSIWIYRSLLPVTGIDLPMNGILFMSCYVVQIWRDCFFVNRFFYVSVFSQVFLLLVTWSFSVPGICFLSAKPLFGKHKWIPLIGKLFFWHNVSSCVNKTLGCKGRVKYKN